MTRLRTLAAVLAALVLVPAASAQARTDDLKKPILSLAGPDAPGKPCFALGKLQSAMAQADVWIGGKKTEWTGHFKDVVIGAPADPSCGSGVPFLQGEGVRHQAQVLGAWINEHYTSRGQAVDVVAYGSTGVILRYAMAMSQAREPGFATGLLVEDAITIASPHDGSPGLKNLCPPTALSCVEMDKGTPQGAQIFNRLATSNPQGKGGTDWSSFGYAGDLVVSADSATAFGMHRTIYTDTKLNHTTLLADTGKDGDASIRYRHGEGEWILWNKAPHTAQRVLDDLARGVAGGDGEGSGTGAYAPGCTGYNDAGSGETLVRDPKLAAWPGDKGDLRAVKFGNVDAISQCFRKDGDKYISTGWTRINGIDLLPKQFLVIEPKTRRVTSASVDYRVPIGPRAQKVFPQGLPLGNDRAIDWRYPEANGALRGDEGKVVNLAGESPIPFAGQKLKGGFSLNVTKGGITLDGNVALPGIFQNELPTGAAYRTKPQCGDGLDNDGDGKKDFSTTEGAGDDDCLSAGDDFENPADSVGAGISIGTSNEHGVRIEKFNAAIDGNFRIRGLKFGGGATMDYSAADDEWKFSAKASIPMLGDREFLMKVAFREGKLSMLYFQGSNLNVPLPYRLYLQRLGVGAAGLDKIDVPGAPLDILLGLGLSWDQRRPIFKGKALVEVDGDATLTIGTPMKLKLEGKTEIFGYGLASGSIEWEQGAGVKLAALFGREIEAGDFKILPQGQIAGAIAGMDDIDLSYRGRTCYSGKIFIYSVEATCVSEATVRVSKFKGAPYVLSFCSTVQIASETYGWGFVEKFHSTNGRVDFDPVFGACDVDLPHVKPAQAGGAAGSTFAVAAGAKAQVVGLRGRGGPPIVTLVGPDGTRIAVPRERDGLIDDRAWVTRAGETTYVLLHRPAAGRWKVEAAEGSVAVASIQTAGVLAQPKVTARLSRGRSGTRVLRYAFAARPGMKVRFVERAEGLSRDLGAVRGPRGTLRFRPAAGRQRARRVVAIVTNRDNPQAEQTVARFAVAPPARPGRVRGVKVVQRGGKAIVTWKRTRGATGGYAVEAQVPGNGRRLVEVSARRRRAVFDTRLTGPVRVKVVGLRKLDGAAGPATSARG